MTLMDAAIGARFGTGTTGNTGRVGDAAVRLSRGLMILYGFGGIGTAVRNSLFALFAVYFYTTVRGLPGVLVGAAAVIALIADLALGPIVGHLSDPAHGRFGRRKLMAIGSVTMGAGFWALFSPPAALSHLTLFCWLLGSSLVSRVGMAVFAVPYLALGADLSEDYHERSAISVVRGILVLAATLAATALSFVLFFPNRTPGIDPKLNPDGYGSMGLLFALVIVGSGVVAVWGTRRLDTHGTTPASGGAVSLAVLGEVRRNRSFSVICSAFFLFFLGVVFSSALAIHYLTYYVRIGSSVALSSFQLAFYLGAALGLVIWLRLSRLADKHVLFSVAAFATAALSLCAFLLVGEGHLLGTGSVRSMLIGHGLGGCLSSVIWFMPQSMIADVSDEEELATGHRRGGAFFGFFYVGRQLAVGTAALLAGVLLDWVAGLQPGDSVQPVATVWRIGLLFGLVPAVVVGLSGVIMLRYTLGERRLAAIHAELHKRRALSAAR